MESEKARENLGLSSEENDLLQRSNKKFKRQLENSSDENAMDVEMLGTNKNHNPGGQKQGPYLRAMQGMASTVNPLFKNQDIGEEDVSDDDIPDETEEDDEKCRY
uniref:Uncharacterized protein n=1 Tax=Chenopodium quinoa TaxID=63459 RepID=A0A803M8U5_CHEQI